MFHAMQFMRFHLGGTGHNRQIPKRNAIFRPGNGLGAGINMTIGTDLAPKGSNTGQFLGLWRVITDSGGTLGPVAVGVFSQLLALGPAALIIGLTGLAGTALMWRFMPESKGFRLQ